MRHTAKAFAHLTMSGGTVHTGMCRNATRHTASCQHSVLVWGSMLSRAACQNLGAADGVILGAEG